MSSTELRITLLKHTFHFLLAMSMIYFYESHEDLANRAGGVLSGGTNSHWYDDVENTTGMDIADIIDLIGPPASEQVAATFESAMDDEYRDERDDSSRLAERHGC